SRVEDHVQQHENDEEYDGKDDLEPLFGAQFKLVFTGPAIGVADGQVQFLLQQIVGLVNEPAVILRLQIEIHVAGERSIFVANHRWPAREEYSRDIVEGDLRTGRSSDENAADRIGVVAKIALVTDVDWEALPAFYVLGNIRAAYRRSNDALHVANGQSVARRLRTVHFDVQVKTLRHAFCKNRTGRGQGREQLLNAGSDVLNLV